MHPQRIEPRPPRSLRNALLLRQFIRLVALLCLTIGLSGCSRDRAVVQPALPQQALVLVVGDSLVAGTGATAESAWPAQLEQHTGWTVINAGIPGNTSADALDRLAPLLAEHQPDAVIIAAGGNDFLRQLEVNETIANLDTMIRQSLEVTRHVALMAIPAPSIGGAVFGTLSDHPLYAGLAQTHELVLLESAVAEVLSRPELRSDRIHANAAGYAEMARRVASILRQSGWLQQ